MGVRHMLAALGVLGLLGCGPGKGLPLPAGGSSSGASDETTSGAGTTMSGATLEGSSSMSLPAATTTTSASTDTSASSAPDTTEGGPNECFFVDPACEPGMKCAVAGPTCDDYPECVPIGEGEKSLLESCQVLGCLGPDDCGPGAYCAFDYSEASPGTCLPACKHGGNVGIHCDDPNEQCILLASAAAIAVCGLVCDVLVQDCPDGMGCAWVGASAGYFSTCVTLADPGGIVDPCEGPSDCQAGLGCAYAQSVPGCLTYGCCTPYCALDDLSSCDAVPGTVCEPLGNNFGFCVKPA